NGRALAGERATRSGAAGGSGRLRAEQPGFHHGVRVEREALDALLDQPAGEVRVVRGALAADTDVLALSAAGADRHRDELAHRLVALVEVARHDGRVAIQPEGELRHV